MKASSTRLSLLGRQMHPAVDAEGQWNISSTQPSSLILNSKLIRQPHRFNWASSIGLPLGREMGMLVSKTFLVLVVNNYIGNREAISLPPALLGAFCNGRCSPLPLEDIDDFSGRLKRDRALFIYSLVSHQFGKYFINDFWSVFCKELQRTKLRSSSHREFGNCSLPFLSSDLLLCLTKVMRLSIV